MRPSAPTAAEALAAVAVGGARAAGAEPATRSEVALAGNVVHLDADAVGVLEEQRVVPRRELRAALGRVHDVRPELVHDEAVDRVDVLAAPRAEAEVMQPRAVLV